MSYAKSEQSSRKPGIWLADCYPRRASDDWQGYPGSPADIPVLPGMGTYLLDIFSRLMTLLSRPPSLPPRVFSREREP